MPTIKPLLQHYNQSLPDAEILVRGDSGLAIPDLYDSCEEKSSYYVIRQKSNRKLGKTAEKSVLYVDIHTWEEREVQYF